MKKTLLCIGLVLICIVSAARYKVRFFIDQLPPYHKASDAIYLAGDFNNWNPLDEKFRLNTIDGKPGIVIELAKGVYAFKFTKGSWNTVESLDEGMPVENRSLRVESDTSIAVAIEHWADHFPKKEKKHTAGRNVHIADTAFFMPRLNRYRRVWIYLPEGYAASKQRYAVLYMHDGQNVFDDATSAYGEWGVDEALDTHNRQHTPLIVVAVDNGGDKRINEYAPYDMEKYGRGEGGAYLDFLVHSLKPFIDERYRTKKDVQNTFIAGSSMGGLISFYALLKYPKVFGGAGVFSPSFHINPQFRHIDAGMAKKVKAKIYFYAGLEEGEQMVPDMLQVFEQMRRHSKATMQTVIRAGGKHNEATWRKEFPLFCKWLLTNRPTTK